MGQAFFICLGQENCQGAQILFFYLLVLVQIFHCDSAREKNFKILQVLICKLFAKALVFRIGLCGFGNVLANQCFVLNHLELLLD